MPLPPPPPSRTLAVAALAATLLAGCVAVATADPGRPAETAATRATMAGVLDSMQTLLPLAYEDGAFRDQAHSAAIDASLDTLRGHTEHLAALGADRDAGFRYLARAIRGEVEEAQHDFKAGRAADAQDRVASLPEYCVACHSRLPSRGDSALGRRLLDGIDVAALPLRGRAQLETMTRQFTAGLTTYEALLDAEAKSGQGVLRLWNVTDYMLLATRVVGDLKRPVPTLEKLAAEPSLPDFVRRDVEAWLDALRELAPQGTEGGIERARALIQEARARNEFPYDRAGLVHYAVASRLLMQYVDTHRAATDELGEAYYLLGVVEAPTGRASWLSTPELYLDTAVRTAPRSPWAKKAFALLEWYVAIEYTGSAGTEIPDDVQRELDALKRLMEAP